MRVDRSITVVAMLCLFLLPVPSRAGNPPVDVGKSLDAMLSYGVPTESLREGVWVVKVAPGYNVNKDNTDAFAKVDMKGPGGAAAVTYAFTDHWGLGLVAGGVRLSGTRVIDTSINGRRDTNLLQPGSGPYTYPSSPGDATGSGAFGAVSVIWDHWSGDDFRMPVFAGLSYLDETEKVENDTLGLRREGKNSSPGIFVGVVPQFNYWKLRVTPFVMFGMTFKNPTTTVASFNPSTGATIKQVTYSDSYFDEGRNIHAVGVGFNYVPWNLGFTLIPPGINPGNSAYTLTWSRKFGERK